MSGLLVPLNLSEVIYCHHPLPFLVLAVMWDQMGLSYWVLDREQMGLPYSAPVPLMMLEISLQSAEKQSGYARALQASRESLPSVVFVAIFHSSALLALSLPCVLVREFFWLFGCQLTQPLQVELGTSYLTPSPSP